MLLSTAYLGNIQYFSKLAGWPEAQVEAYENFQKQTYRNRAHVMTAGGVKALTVPVVWRHGQKMPIRAVEIDYTLPWQREHWRTLRAGYAAAPFFDHYAEKLEKFYDPKCYKPRFLFDLNTELTETLLALLGLPQKLNFTTDYQVPQEAPDDFRECISHKPRLKCEDPDFASPVYYQVFEDRIPFAENLSAIDLLFCEGPHAGVLIRESHPDFNALK